MGARDHLNRVLEWFGFGVPDDDDYYDEEEEGGRPYTKDPYASGRFRGDAVTDEPGPTVRRLSRSERSSAWSTSLGNLFTEGTSSRRDHSYDAGAGGSSHLRPVPDQQVPPTRVSVVDPSSFNDAQALADRFKRQQPVILNLQNADADLSRRMVDFCAGLTYALDGQIQTVANRVFLLTPRNVEVSAEERKRLAERAFFNQL